MNLKKTELTILKYNRISSVLIIFLTLFVVFVSFYFNGKSDIVSQIELDKKNHLRYHNLLNKNTLRVAISFIEKSMEEGKQNSVDISLVKKNILDSLNAIKLGNKDSNYIFVMEIENLDGGKNFAKKILFPISSGVDGNYISDDKQDSKGRFYRKDYLEQIRNNGEAVVRYSYIKENGDNKEIDKLSYLVYLPNLKWIIGTGTYLDQLDAITKKDLQQFNDIFKRELLNTIILFVLLGTISFLIAVFFGKKYKQIFLEYSKESNKNKNLLEQYKSTVDRSFIVSKTDAAGIITYANDEFCRVSGYTLDELVGKPHNIVRHPDNPQSLYKELWETIKEEKKYWTGNIKNISKDGKAYYVQSVINPILDQNENVIEYIGIRTDITQQEEIKQYFEEQMHLSNKQFSSALNLAKEYERAINESTILIRTDLNGKLLHVNDKFIEITGFSEDELLEKGFSLIRPKENPKEVFKNMWETIQAGKIWKGVLKNKNKNNQTYWIESTIVPIIDENGKITEYMSISNDLTDMFNLHSEIEETQRDIIYKMGEIGETRSKETGNHVKRVAEYSKILANLYGLEKEQIDTLFSASPMHDIGKVGIPDNILSKPGKLTDDEFIIMKTHSKLGYNILKNSNREVLQAAAVVAYEHHEKWDGTGYPRGLKGENIHIYGRITAVADVFDALGSDRCYKKAWELEDIFILLEKEKGKHFDPKLIELFLNNKDKFLEIREKYKD